MLRFLAAILLLRESLAGWCDEWGAIEWSDEFEGEKLDTSKWSIVCNDLEGDASCDSLPFHTSANGAECRSATCIADAVSVSDGYLTLISDRNPNNSSLWTTGAVKTLNKAAWSTDDGSYRVCISAKLPGGGGEGKGQGIWPAHWMMPQDDSCDPDEGEMDIMEMVDGDGTAWSTYHWQANWPQETCAYPDGHDEVYGKMYLGDTWAEEFHEYGVERTADYVAFTIDGQTIVNSSSTTDREVLLWTMPFYLILNTAVGGSWPGEPDDRTISPTYHIIDYVRLAREEK